MLYVNAIQIKKLHRFMWVVAAGVVACFALAGRAEAATVYHCTDNAKQCVIRLEEGIVGDRVQVLDERARIVAQGRITKRKGAFAIINLQDVAKNIRKGFPVIVNIENRTSSLQWAASFADRNQ